MTEALGYSFNNGGLNNQRLAFLGLFISGFLQKRSIILPFMYSKDVPREKNSLIPLENCTVPIFEVFDESGIRRLAKKYDIPVEDVDPSSLEMGGWDYFNTGAGGTSGLAVNADRSDLSDLVRDFFVEIVPLARSSYILSRLKQDLFRQSPIRRLLPMKDLTLAAQFRIESDWQYYSGVTLQPTVGSEEHFNITYDHILQKIKNSIPSVRNVIAIYDEAATNINKEEVRHLVKKTFKIDLLWKSDFLTPFETRNLGPLALSMIDFELARAADKFVGLSRSTFSNMVTFERFIARRSRVTTDYIYNTNNAFLGLRTDNGGHADPREATK